MAVLKPGVPHFTEEPGILIENELPEGRYVFELVVTDDEGNDSIQATHVVTIIRSRSITPEDPVFGSGGTIQ